MKIRTADKFTGQVVVITLCAAVKAGFLYQPVEYIVTEGGVAAVFTGQADDPSGSIVFHTARQTALCGTDGLSPRIVLCPVSAAVRGNDGGQVTAALYSYRVSWPCVSFTAINCPRLSYARY